MSVGDTSWISKKTRQQRKMIGAPTSNRACALRNLGVVAVCILLTATLLACASGGEDSAGDERVLDPEAKIQSLEESFEALADENVELRGEIAILGESLDDLDERLRELEEVTSKVESVFPDKGQWTKDERVSLPEGTALERTVRLVEDSGGEVHYVDYPEREDRVVLVTPLEFVDGETPLIGSLHGFGGNSADQISYVPLHERVNTDGFALLLPNGTVDGEGNRFWNPTDRCCDSGKTGEDYVAYLTELVEAAREVKDFGSVYFFGYSNGGFMSYHMACKGLPGLRAVASLAGTSYAGDQEMVTRWSQRAGCDWTEHTQPYASFDLDQFVPGPETQALRLDSGCAEGINIELWMGEGSGHSPNYGDAFVDALVGWFLAQG